MPVPTDISQLSQTAASNSPAGSESPTTADDYLRTYASYIAQLRDGKGFAQEATVASAATADIGAANSLYVQITGTTTITSFGTNYNGPRFVRFAGTLTLTHNASTLILPGAANITTAAGDTCVVVPNGNAATGWRVMAYQVGSVVPGTPADNSVTAAKIASNAVTTPKILDANVTPAKLANSGYELGMRNRIINGDMRIDQRNAGASITPAQDQFMTDRWKWGQTQSSKFSAQQSSTAPAGFVNSLLMTVTAAVTVGASDYFSVYQPIEGLNVSDLGWGTANAQSVTLSFKVRSSLTGTFGGSLRNSAGSRSYPFTYTISSANTWTDITVTIPGDTSGTWLTTSGVGLFVNFGLGVGTTLSGPAGAWAAANYLSATGAVSVVGTNAATFYITGVQLERGSNATPFEHRSHGVELSLCQRYYFRLSGAAAYGSGFTAGALTASYGYFALPTYMRSAPTASYSNIAVSDNNTYTANVTSISATSASNNSCRLTVAHGSTGSTTYKPCEVVGNAAASYVDFTSEL